MGINGVFHQGSEVLVIMKRPVSGRFSLAARCRARSRAAAKENPDSAGVGSGGLRHWYLNHVRYGVLRSRQNCLRPEMIRTSTMMSATTSKMWITPPIV